MRAAFQRACFTLALCFCCISAAAQNYSDIWWNPLESGWGITIADHETQLFAVWFTYGADRQPTWFVLPGGAFNSDRTTFTGDLYQTTGPAFTALPFDTTRVTLARVGTATFHFAPQSSPSAAPASTFTYTVGNVTQTRNIQRQPFGNANPWWGMDDTDIWWNAAESGWGLTLAQHGNNIFGVWYTYGADGKPLFIAMPTVTFNGANSFTGPLYTTTGPSYTNPLFNSQDVTIAQVGSATLEINGSTGTFTATVNGVSQSHAIVRQPFGLPRPADPNPGGETWHQAGVAVGFQAANMPAGVGSLIMSEVVRLADGTYRMYFTGIHPGSSAADIWLADSPDASSWTVRAKVLEGSANASDPEYQVQGPSLVHLGDGRWRMYYDATPAFNVSAGISPHFQLFSAISNDGVTFVREGVRVPSSDFSPGAELKSAAHGRVVALDSGGYQAYLSALPNGRGSSNGIYQLHSDDGLTFGGAQLILAVAHDPVVLKAEGGYVMYADPSPNSGFSPIDHAVKLTSSDGVTWSAPDNVVFTDGYGARLGLGGTGAPGTIGDFGAVVLASGKLRLFSNYNVQNLAFYDRAIFP